MDRMDIIQKLKEYNRTLSETHCTSLEKKFINQINDNKKYFFYFSINQSIMDTSAEDFLKRHHNFKGLLPKANDKLCLYMRHIQEYTCNHHLI